MAETEKKVTLYSFGLEPEVAVFLKELGFSAELIPLTSDDLGRLIETPPNDVPALVISGETIDSKDLLEGIQALKAIFQETKILHISEGPCKTPPDLLTKNGVDELFSTTMDKALIRKRIEEALAAALKLKAYRQVLMPDLVAGQVIDFDLYIYLPLNKKYVCYVPAGDIITEEKLRKLKEKKLQTAYVSLDEMQKFKQYLKNLFSEGPSSESTTEKVERRQRQARNILFGIFSSQGKEGTFDQGKAVTADCTNLIQDFMKTKQNGPILQKILEVFDDSVGVYSHASRVSNLCVLFSMVLGIGKPEVAGMAGLMHDLGEALLPKHLIGVPYETMNSSDQTEYKKHIEHTFEMIKRQKVILSDPIRKAIEQHHERINGSGYPKGMTGDRMTPEAQVLALADEFDYLTSIDTGRGKLSPKDALVKLRNEMTSDPAKVRHNIKWVDQILASDPTA